MDEPDTQEYIIRDLKDYVLGKEYTTDRDGKIIVKDKPSMTGKVEFVRQNISALGEKSIR